MKPVREATDATIIARLKSRAGHQYQVGSLAEHFVVSHKTMNEMLKRLAASGAILSAYYCSHYLYFWTKPEEEQKKAPDVPKVFPTYVMPDALKTQHALSTKERVYRSKGGD